MQTGGAPAALCSLDRFLWCNPPRLPIIPLDLVDDEDFFLSKSKNELLFDRIFDIVGPFESVTEVEAIVFCSTIFSSVPLSLAL